MREAPGWLSLDIKMAARRPIQLEMKAIVDSPARPVARTWGGRRPGAGRPRKHPRQRAFIEHVARPPHKKRHPVHITVRARKGLPSFRHQLVHRMVQAILEAQPERRYGGDFQVVHYSVQSNHLHLIVEATDKRKVRSGVSGLVIAFAKRLNKLLARLTGKVWADRYHRRDLTTPSEVRNALVYLLQNFRKHGTSTRGPVVDHFSSARLFAGWTLPVDALPTPARFPPRRPRTWLLGTGWTLHGPLSPREAPAPAPAPA